ncbi:hypothetical protein HW260_00170 [Helicobacter cinaedi]|uniref:Uncharacterized protein n=1 Tax=Helicobacter cinaedi CCUG 18818 = ATCC BAA-847 TaxID=537971 RepID=A0AAI8MKM0_9HELI|nr:hypothetical protein [Helicobacter cinaedi]EFR45911.1 hypothetical protein HCCG_00457 [Helicobacter cinaedi CCUG 18818 = ATCC BAA-847]QOQ90826.1 hypothetical protein HW260_00170 [Helicobacter cinaedi]BAM33272.1 hypothetical protein HCBAA847_2054 [Helicobacter cinaedi CCUG 18818 = ATCC BAA-847]
MSYISTKDLNLALKREFILTKTYKLLLPYFKAYKNPKIFLFLMGLIEKSSLRSTRRVIFNILDTSYEFDICEKTIKSWLKQLENLKLLKTQSRKGQIYAVELFDYEAAISKAETEQKQTQSTSSCRINLPTPTAEIPTRFYKNIQNIINKIIKTQGLQEKKFKLDEEQWRLAPSQTKTKSYKNIIVEFENTHNLQFTALLTYEQITGKSLPSLSHPYHQQIIRANLKKSLKLMAA